jgi:hypothetical protein
MVYGCKGDIMIIAEHYVYYQNDSNAGTLAHDAQAPGDSPPAVVIPETPSIPPETMTGYEFVQQPEVADSQQA